MSVLNYTDSKEYVQEAFPVILHEMMGPCAKGLVPGLYKLGKQNDENAWIEVGAWGMRTAALSIIWGNFKAGYLELPPVQGTKGEICDVLREFVDFQVDEIATNATGWSICPKCQGVYPASEIHDHTPICDLHNWS